MAEHVSLRSLEPAARFVLQGPAAARRAAGDALGLLLPEAACRASTAGGRSALWLGPDERLLLAPADEGRALAARLEPALAGIPHSLVDVGHRQVGIGVAGPRATDVLNSGCPLDLDAHAFPPGSCTRTVLGKVEVILWRRRDEEYHLEVWRSFSGYVLGWLREAVRSEFL